MANQATSENLPVAAANGTPVGGQYSDDSQKLFIGGLSRETTDDGFRNFFLKFGEMSDCVVMRHPSSSISRGFGFVTFVEPSSRQAALDATRSTLDGRKLDIKAAISREDMEQIETAKASGQNAKKIIVQGLSLDTSKEDLEAFFTSFGPIVEAVIITDRETRKSRGFGFITFERTDAVAKACAGQHKMGEREITCAIARPKEPRQDEGGQGGGYRTGNYGGYGGGGYSSNGYGSYGGGGYGGGYGDGGGYGGGGGYSGGGGYGASGGYGGGYGAGGGGGYGAAPAGGYGGGGYGAASGSYSGYGGFNGGYAAAGGGGYGAPSRGGGASSRGGGASSRYHPYGRGGGGGGGY